MICPVCNSEDHGVIDTAAIDGAIRRRRACGNCKHRWTTFERNEHASVTVPAAELEAVRDSISAILTRR